jgi:hypothetical protein
MLRAVPVILILLSPALVAQDAARQAASRSPSNANYVLDATLDPVNRLIVGTGTLTWRNTATISATELRFHMDWNAWRDQTSTWMREQRAADPAAFRPWPDGDAGAIDLTALTMGDRDLLARAHFIAPDDGNAADRTVLAVPLDPAVPPGDTIAIEFSWNGHVPSRRTAIGADGPFFFVARWFPRIGMFEDAGWICHQFHRAGGSDGDYGTYDVHLTLPPGWIVGATGREQPARGAGTRTHAFAARDVRDFAWTASPAFAEIRERFAEADRPGVDIRLLLQPAHRDQASRYLTAVRTSLLRGSEWLGPYPYDELTVVDPAPSSSPRDASVIADRMVFPMVVLAGTRTAAPWRGLEPEAAIAAGVGLQFLAGGIGVNGVDHAWMERGLNTYLGARLLDDASNGRFVVTERYFGGLLVWPYQDIPWSRVIDGDGWARYRAAPNRDDPSAPSWRDWPATAGETTAYRTALWLESIERVVGWPSMARRLAAYQARGRFTHAQPADFSATVSEAGGALPVPVERANATPSVFDYAVAAVDQLPLETGAIDSTILIRRNADGVWPIDVRVSFTDGSSVVEHWDGEAPSRMLRYRRGAAVRAVDVDPDRVLLLDVNTTNNTWRRDAHAADAAVKWATRWFAWAQHLLLTYAFFS